MGDFFTIGLVRKLRKRIHIKMICTSLKKEYVLLSDKHLQEMFNCGKPIFRQERSHMVYIAFQISRQSKLIDRYFDVKVPSSFLDAGVTMAIIDLNPFRVTYYIGN